MVNCCFIFDVVKTEAKEQGVKVVVNTKLELYINGKYKFLFMMARRLGYCVGYCLCCCLRQSEWKQLHKRLDSTRCGVEESTIQALTVKLLLSKNKKLAWARLFGVLESEKPQFGLSYQLDRC